MTGQQRLAVFDLCDTLYAANTSVGFLRHYAATTQDRRIAKRLDRWLNRRSAFFYLGAALFRLGKYDLPRKRMIAALAGERRDRLSAVARDYVSQVLPPLANDPVQKLLAEHQAAGDRVVLVSSSLDLVVEPIAEALGAEYRASALEWAEDVCTGRLASDLTGRKTGVVRTLLAGQQTELVVYTDNRSDRELVRMADKATIIIPKGADRQHWAGETHEYLTL